MPTFICHFSGPIPAKRNDCKYFPCYGPVFVANVNGVEIFNSRIIESAKNDQRYGPTYLVCAIRKIGPFSFPVFIRECYELRGEIMEVAN